VNNTTTESAYSEHEQDDPHIANVAYKGIYKTTVRKTISIPEKLHGCALLQCMIKFLKVHTASRLFNLYKFATSIPQLISFISENYQTPQSIPKNILQIYSQHLSDQGNAQSSIRTILGHMGFVLAWTISQPWFKTFHVNDRVLILAVLDHKPSIPKNAMLDGTAPAMSELVDGKEFDDRDLLDSLIRFCAGFLTVFKRHRSIIVSNRRVAERLEISKSSSAPDIDWHFREPSWDDYNEIFNAIVASRDATLIERLLFSNQTFKDYFISAGSPDTLEDLYKKLKTCVREVGSIRFTDKLRTDNQYITFEQLDIRSLLSPCEAEEICMRWFLAVDRIQQSGQKHLRLEDIEITPTHATVSFLKMRSNEYQRESTSHKRKTFNYKILEYFLELRTSLEESFLNLPKARNSADITEGTDAVNPDLINSSTPPFFQFENPFARRQSHSSITYRPIVFACTPGTNLYEEICTLYPKAKLFQEYFKLLVDENTAAHRAADQRIQLGLEQAGPSSEPLTYRLSANVIAQSRAIVDPEQPILPSAFDHRARAEAAADASAHSINVHQEVYQNRSQTAHRIGQRKTFVDQVGRLQESDARKVASYMQNTTIVSLSEIDDLLGWGTELFKNNDIEDFNRMTDIAEAKGFNCVPFGWLSKPQAAERIIIICPIVAAMILSFISTCQSELKNSKSLERAHSILLQLCYAKLVLKNFDQRTIADGKQILKKYDLPSVII
jgi:hypothetical protein